MISEVHSDNGYWCGHLPQRWRIVAGAAAIAAALVAVAVPGVPAHAQGRVTTLSSGEARSTSMAVPLNKSQVLRVDRPFSDISVGNPDIADVVTLTDQTIYVLGKALGSTNLSIYDQSHRLIAVLDVVVTQDASELKAKLSELLPGETIGVRSANDSVVLSGAVPSAAVAGRAAAIAEKYAPGKVVNLLQVKGSQQVMLSVKVAEMSRTTARELGIKPQNIALGKNGNPNFGFATIGNGAHVPGSASFPNGIATASPDRFAQAVFNWTTGFLSFNLLIDALEQKGVVKILAEPNLVALSGDTANFLAGGEFPVPVAQNSTNNIATITVAFKQFGVSLAFTPTVIDDGLVNLVVSPEVSEIDPNNSVTVSGFVIPGIATRRATTTVELRDGQSFAIAGLMQSNLQDQVRQVPGLGNLPIIGSLFRDSQISQTDKELVIIVTPTVVKPAPAGSLLASTDYFVPPVTADLFFNGNVEAPGSGTPAVQRALTSGASGGLSGNYGYIVK